MTNQLITQPEQTKLKTQSAKRIKISFLEEKLSPDFDFKGFAFNRQVTLEELNRAKEEIESSLIPASDKELAKGLTILSVLTKSRNEGVGDLEVKIETYLEKLKEYPRDVALEVLERATKNYKFFPSWSELREDLEWRSGYANVALEIIDSAILREGMKESK